MAQTPRIDRLTKLTDSSERLYIGVADLSANAQKKTKDKKDKSLRTPLFRVIPRDNKSHAMLYNVGFW